MIEGTLDVVRKIHVFIRASQFVHRKSVPQHGFHRLLESIVETRPVEDLTDRRDRLVPGDFQCDQEGIEFDGVIVHAVTRAGRGARAISCIGWRDRAS